MLISSLGITVVASWRSHPVRFVVVSWKLAEQHPNHVDFDPFKLRCHPEKCDLNAVTNTKA